jgi:hypothetical protein
MLTVEKDCRIGASITTKLQKDDSDPTMEIPIIGATLDREELIELVGDPLIWVNWFDERAGDKLPEPTWAAKFHSFVFGHKFKECRAIFALGVAREMLTLEDVTIAKINLLPMVGGLTAFDFVIQCTPDMGKASRLFVHMTHTANITLKIGTRDEGDTAKPQAELGLVVDKETGVIHGKTQDGTHFTVTPGKAKAKRKPNGKVHKVAKRKSSSHVSAH